MLCSVHIAQVYDATKMKLIVSQHFTETWRKLPNVLQERLVNEASIGHTYISGWRLAGIPVDSYGGVTKTLHVFSPNIAQPMHACVYGKPNGPLKNNDFTYLYVLLVLLVGLL